MNSAWCPDKEMSKNGHEASFSIVQTKINNVSGRIKESRARTTSKVLPSKGKGSMLPIFGANFQPAHNNNVRIDTIKKGRFVNSDKIRNKNNQLLSWLQNGYILLKPSSIADFIKGHKELISLLNEAYKELRKYFPTEGLKIELVSDAEIAGDQQLFVYISTSLSVADALNKLDEFDEKWWLDRIDRANGLLNFNLRFI